MKELVWFLVISIVCFDVSGVRSTITKRAHTCQYQNTTYSSGEKFQPDPCTFCRCPRRGGRVVCAIQDCKWEPHCLQFDPDRTACCPLCLKYGCIHSDGKVYKIGEVVVDNKCGRCYCPPTGGRTVCDITPCKRPKCVDAETKDNECCAVCPKGPNCQRGRRIIPAGKRLDIDGHVCRCKPIASEEGTILRAVCRKKIH